MPSLFPIAFAIGDTHSMIRVTLPVIFFFYRLSTLAIARNLLHTAGSILLVVLITACYSTRSFCEEPLSFDYSATAYSAFSTLDIRTPAGSDGFGLPTQFLTSGPLSDFYNLNPTVTGSFSYFPDTLPDNISGGQHANYTIQEFTANMRSLSGDVVDLVPSEAEGRVSQDTLRHDVEASTSFFPVFIQGGLPLDTLTGQAPFEIDLVNSGFYATQWDDLPNLPNMPIQVVPPDSYDLLYLRVVASDSSKTALPDGDLSLPRFINARDFKDSFLQLAYEGEGTVRVAREDYPDDASYSMAQQWVSANIQTVDVGPTFNWDANVGVDPLKYAGGVARSYTIDRQFPGPGTSTESIDSQLFENLNVEEAEAYAFASRTNSGSAVARASVSETGMLSVDASANAAGTHGDAVGRSVAFMPFTNTTNRDLQLQVNALLDGEFSTPGSGEVGRILAKAGVYVLDTDAFEDLTMSQKGDLEEWLLGVPENAEREPVNAADLYGKNRLSTFENVQVLSFQETELNGAQGPFNEIIEVDLSTGLFSLKPGESITVLFDVAARSTVQLDAGGQGGAGKVDFLSTLAPADSLFTNELGEPIELTQGFINGVVVPEPSSAFLAAFLGVMTVSRMTRHRHGV